MGDYLVEEIPQEPDIIRDKVSLSLAGLEICLSRQMEIDLPHEVTVVVPRAEIRKKCPTENCPDCQLEIILNSITIAHSPRPFEEEGDGSSLLESAFDVPREEENKQKEPYWKFVKNE